MIDDAGPCIIFDSPYSCFKKRMIFLDDLIEQKILFTVIDTCMQKQFQLNPKVVPSLHWYRKILSVIFYDIIALDSEIEAKNNEMLLFWFFHHLYVMPDPSVDFNFYPSKILRVNDRIFFAVDYSCSYSTEILSLVTKEEYPQLFDYIHAYDTKLGHAFNRYLVTKDDATEYLYMPEFSTSIKRKIHRFYEHLLDTFGTLDFAKDAEEEAEKVFDYLYIMFYFFDTEISIKEPFI